MFDAVLFDLDGTLIDSAPDLAGAANAMRRKRGLPDLPFSALRPMVGAGARGMVGAALGCGPNDEDFPQLRDEFLRCYETQLTQRTTVFAEIVPVLQALGDMSMAWGIVTNKATRFAQPLVAHLSLHQHSEVLICGDTTPHAKPHPAPLLEAARLMNVAAARCLYVGDDLRDIQAGSAAGMRTAAAAWGYLGQGDSIHDWDADHLLTHPNELLNLLRLP